MNRTPDKLMEEALRILPGYTYWNAGEMANIHSFLARVTSDGVLNFDNIALSFLGRALEEEPARASSFSTLDDHVPTAAVWILYARRCIYTNRTLWEYDEDETRMYGDMGEDRKLYDGSRGFCAERWASWKMRFEFVVACEAVKELARKIAGEALAKMVEIEGDAEMVEGPNVA
jgi:hypothetical protein